MNPVELYLKDLLSPCNKTAFQHESKSISKQKFLADVASLQINILATSHQRWALCYQNSYQFSVALFAVLTSQRIPILLSNNQAGTVANFVKSYDAILTDFPHLTQTCFPEILDEKPCVSVLKPSQEIILFTSGSTGNPKKIACSLVQLFSEVADLEQCFGEKMQGKTIYTTVSHQHIYGLLFTVLWPLAVGRIVCYPALEYPEDIQRLADQQSKVVLVASPALLKRLPQAIHIARDWVIFSSGGSLMKAEAKNVAESLGYYPIEVLGSTETGGVGHRQQHALEGKDYWACFPSVSIEVDVASGCLCLDSPFFAGSDPFIMGDRVEILENGRFALLGRVDRIVKIEEKRVSLTEIEQHLDQTSWVQSSRAIPMCDHRQYIAVVVVLSEIGNTILVEKGKLSVNKLLQQALTPYFERVLLPKKFRYVEVIPTNAQGKMVQADLQKLFETI